MQAHGGNHENSRFAHPLRTVAHFGIEPGMKIADFGAGSGAYVNIMSEALLGSGTVYAIDIQKDLLRRIKNAAEKEGHTNVEVLWSDLEEKGSKLGSVLDIVLISNLLFQVHDKKAIFREAERVLKEGGRVIVIDWSESPPKGEWRLGPPKEAIVTKEKAFEYARDAGLSFLKEFPTGAHHYGLIFRKTKSHAPRA